MRLSISNVALLVLGFQSTVFGRAIPEALSYAGNSALLEDSHLPRHLTPRVIKPVPVRIGAPKAPDNPNPANTDPRTQRVHIGDSSTGGGGSNPKKVSVHIGESSTGSGGDLNRVLSYDTYRTKGESVNTQLSGAIKNSDPDTGIRPAGKSIPAEPVRDSTPEEELSRKEKEKAEILSSGKYANINDGYGLSLDRGWSETKDLQAVYDYIPESGLTQSMRWDKYLISSKTDGVTLPANDGAYDRRSGTIMAVNNFQDRDKWAKGDYRRLPWSELTWQTWVKTTQKGRGFPKNDVANLKYVIRRNVQNKGTVSVVEQAHSKNGIPMNQRGEFEVDPTNVEKSNAFYALLGTDNAKGVAFMLKDHHNEVDNKVIKKIVTFPKGSPNTDNKLSMLIILGK